MSLSNQVLDALIEDRPDDVRKIINDLTLDSKGYHGLTPLMVACRHGYLDIVQKLLALGSAPNAKDDLGQTPVIIAATYGRHDILHALVTAKANLEEVDIFGKNCLNYADVETAKTLISLGKCIRDVPNDIPDDVRECIQAAKDSLGLQIFDASIKEATDLLEKWANINVQNENGSTALIHSCIDGHQKSHLKFLIEKGANVNIRNKQGYTALICASSDGHYGVVKSLLKNGADPNVQNEDGCTALMFASMYGYLKTATKLIKKGADPNRRDTKGATALIHAVGGMNSIDMVKLLLENGADVNAKDINGNTALMRAVVGTNSIDMVKLLLKNGADPLCVNKNGRSALNQASERTILGTLFRHIAENTK
jgi:ankyrin repeat protein